MAKIRRRPEVRLYGKEVYVFYPKKIGIGDKNILVRGYSNKRVLSERSGVGYDNLVRVFTREKRHYYENEDVIILRMFVSDIVKGRQSIVRRGQGGMESFRRFVIGKRTDDY